MTLLRFTLTSPELQGIDVPIEVRDSKMKLLHETSASRPVPVPAGSSYVITARFPAGQTITDVVKAEGAEMSVALGADEEQEPEATLYFASERAMSAAAPPPLPKKRKRRSAARSAESAAAVVVPAATMRFFSGNALDANAHPVALTPETRSTSPVVSELYAPPSNECRFLRCAHANLPPVNIALPVSGERGCSIVVRRETKRYWVEVYPLNPQAKLLLGYAQNQLVQSEAAVAKRLLFEKVQDPIGATIGAYSLLRVTQLKVSSEIGDWLANLMMYFDWLPDGAAVRAEHLARWGKHDEALKAFVEVTRRGLPLFSDGIRYTHDRLRYYADVTNEIAGAAQAQKALERIKPFVRQVDFTKSVTTFLGTDPNHPGPSDPLQDTAGMNVASLFA